MTFRRMLYKMTENPKLKFRSKEAFAEEQDYKSIIYWFFKVKPKKFRSLYSRKFMLATDWEIENDL